MASQSKSSAFNVIKRLASIHPIAKSMTPDEILAMADIELPRPITPAKPSVPFRTIERLGIKHSDDSPCYRVRVGEDIYTGQTESQAITGAVIAILKNGPTTIDIQPPWT